MNKVQVGSAPSPNLKTVRSKIGSLDNASYRPGGGKVKIENRKVDFSKTQPKIAAKNDTYVPGGGDKKVSVTGEKKGDGSGTSDVIQEKVGYMRGGSYKKMSGTGKRSMIQGLKVYRTNGSDKEVSDALSSSVVQEKATNVTACTVCTRREWHCDTCHCSRSRYLYARWQRQGGE
jgi:hypothetical protein